MTDGIELLQQQSRSPPLLEMRSIRKSYPGVQALRGVDLSLYAGEVLALLGENGAGKSTLMKILGGALHPDEGEIRINGELVSLNTPLEARSAGVAMIYQEMALVPSLSARENLFLGRERTRLGWINHSEETRQATQLFSSMGMELNIDIPCWKLSIAQQQSIEIAKALAVDARILVMDEPTATLTPREVERLFVIVRQLCAKGWGVIYISHRLDEIYNIADRVTILRDGCHISTRSVDNLARNDLIESMVGRELTHEFPSRSVALGSVRLDVRGLSRGQVVRNVSFCIRQGEIVALTGLVGAGRTEAARLIFGADQRDTGDIYVDGKFVTVRDPIDAIQVGIGLLTEDRKHEGLILNHSIRENFSLPNLKNLSRFWYVSRMKEKADLVSYSSELKLRFASIEQPVGQLSGGNQQKVVLAKWLARDCKVLIFDEPTRGIDVGAKYEIYLLMNQLAALGKTILMISSELPEVLGMADRILVMHDGRITGEVTNAKSATQAQIMELAVL